MKEILFVLWFFWPAGVATMMPVVAAHTPGLQKWKTPMDFGRSWRGHRLLGNNKTWRGFVIGTLSAVLWFAVLMAWYNHSEFVRSFSHLNYGQAGALWIGLGLGVGAMVGDAVGSFAKRQLDIQPGQSWFPYDQIDFILGGIIFTLPFVRLSVLDYVVTLLVWIGVHLLFGVIGYGLRWKNAPL